LNLSPSRLLVSLLCVPLLTACTDVPESEELVQVKPDIAAVKVHELREQSWQSSVHTFGVVEALEEVDVAAELSGTVKAVYVSEGDRVEAGQLLLELDSEKRELGVRRARQSAQQARTVLDEARLKLERRRELAEQKTISEEVLDSAKLTVEAAAASYEEALAAQQLAERELADTRIVSPTPGLVEVKAVEPGEAVTIGLEAIDENGGA
jgi:RND family efflux transporter MFP subunit